MRTRRKRKGIHSKKKSSNTKAQKTIKRNIEVKVDNKLKPIIQ
jgi:hypothetical protein